jgi:hypothetical protein
LCAGGVQISWLANITKLLPIYTVGEFADQLSLITQVGTGGSWLMDGIWASGLTLIWVWAAVT